MDEKNTMDVFSKAPVPQAVLKNALPAMAAMVMVLIYNLADTFFIAQTHDDLQVAAVSLAMPVFLVFMALGTMFGVGGTSVISRSLGEGKIEYAKKVCSFCMWSCIVVGTIMAALFLAFMDQILVLVGASADTWEYTKTYLTIVSLGGPFVLISNCYSSIFRAEGKAVQATMGQLIGNLLNVILDPVMILSFGWDIAGAAIATVIGNVAAACYYLQYFLRGKSALSIHIRDFTLKDKVCGSVLAIGIPAALDSLLMSVSQIILNGQMTHYSDMAVAGMGVAMKVTMIIVMLSMGIGQGVQPLLGYCVGAQLWKRFKKVLRFSLLFALALGTVLTVICCLFVEQLVRVFLSAPDAYTYGVDFCRILLASCWLFGVFYVLMNTLQAMGAATPAFIINISRRGIIFISALFILQAAMGITGLVWAQPVADVLATGLVAVLYGFTVKKLAVHPENEARS